MQSVGPDKQETIKRQFQATPISLDTLALLCYSQYDSKEHCVSLPCSTPLQGWHVKIAGVGTAEGTGDFK
jgi:hypothetical protein